MRNPSFVVIALVLSGCGSTGGQKLADSPNFQSGYADGCASANQQGADFRERQIRDEALFKVDESYRAGWSNGFSSCRTTNMPTGTQPGANPLSSAVPGSH